MLRVSVCATVFALMLGGAAPITAPTAPQIAQSRIHDPCEANCILICWKLTGVGSLRDRVPRYDVFGESTAAGNPTGCHPA